VALSVEVMKKVCLLLFWIISVAVVFRITTSYLSSVETFSEIDSLRNEIQRLEQKMPYVLDDPSVANTYAKITPFDDRESSRTTLVRISLPNSVKKYQVKVLKVGTDEKWEIVDSQPVDWSGIKWIRWSWAVTDEEVIISTLNEKPDFEFRVQRVDLPKRLIFTDLSSGVKTSRRKTQANATGLSITPLELGFISTDPVNSNPIAVPKIRVVVEAMNK
jgi:hypothetical protein